MRLIIKELYNITQTIYYYREVNVSLICDQSVEDAIVAVTGEGALTYVCC